MGQSPTAIRSLSDLTLFRRDFSRSPVGNRMGQVSFPKWGKHFIRENRQFGGAVPPPTTVAPLYIICKMGHEIHTHNSAVTCEQTPTEDLMRAMEHNLRQTSRSLWTVRLSVSVCTLDSAHRV